jgi:hypothetical protein
MTQYGLSSMQKVFWFFSHRPHGQALQTYEFIFFSGPLDTEALHKAFLQAVEHHEILRSIYPVSGGYPAQLFPSAADGVFVTVDLDALPASGRASRLKALVAEECARRMDLARGPLFWGRLYSLSQEEHVFLMPGHHIQTDLRSCEILTEELLSRYAGDVAGAPCPPNESARFAESLAIEDAAEAPATALAHWRESLSTAKLVPLPRRSTKTETSYLVQALPTAFNERLTHFAKAHNIRPFAILLAALGMEVAFETGCRDMALGFLDGNRRDARFARSVGPFARGLPVRVCVGESQAWGDLLEETNRQLALSLAHALPLITIARACSRADIFNITLNYFPRPLDWGKAPERIRALAEQISPRPGLQIFPSQVIGELEAWPFCLLTRTAGVRVEFSFFPGKLCCQSHDQVDAAFAEKIAKRVIGRLDDLLGP